MKHAKKAFLASALATLLCITMLVGTTFAWFTDSVTSGGNIIKSGTLNIDLGIKAKGDTDYVSVKTDATKKAFNYDKWEPGYTEWVNAKVYTTGNLALKYTLKITANGTVSNLADVIDVYYAASEVALPGTRPADLEAAGLTKIGTLKDALSGTVVIDDTLIPGTNEEDFATLALHMQESAGNEYQNLAIGTDFSLQILATQFTYEEDSFDDQYDANAEFGDVLVASNSAELGALLAELNDNQMSGDPVTIKVGAGTYADPISIELFPNEADFGSTDYVNNIPAADQNQVHLKANGDAVVTNNLTITGSNRAQSGLSALQEGSGEVIIEGFTFEGTLQDGDVDTVVVKLTRAAHNVTFKNCTFKTQTHINVGTSGNGAAGTVIFDGCTFDQAACFSGAWYDLQIKNCTGVVDSGKGKGLINSAREGTTTVTNCTFDLGNIAYIVRTNGSNNAANFSDCTFTGSPALIVKFRGSNHATTFTNCTLNGAAVPSTPAEGVGTNGTLTIN